MHVISRLIPWPSRLVAVLTVSCLGSVFSFELDSSFLSFEAVIARVDGVCLGL